MSRITVTPADEDEVIIAGATSDAPAEGERLQAAVSVEQTEANGASAPMPTNVSQREAPSPLEEPFPSGGQSASDEPRRKQSKARDEFQGTTLEDLESTSMPLAQRIVIVAAVVCIIGALVYYFVAMR